MTSLAFPASSQSPASTATCSGSPPETPLEALDLAHAAKLGWAVQHSLAGHTRVRLPIVVRPVRLPEERPALQALRVRAYARHYPPEFVQVVAEEQDRALEARALTLLALDRLQTRLLGTVRVRMGPHPDLPHDAPEFWHSVEQAPYLYTDRLVVPPSEHALLVLLALFKAQWFYAYQAGAQAIAGKCVEALVRRYRQLGLEVLEAPDGRRWFGTEDAPGVRWFAMGAPLWKMPEGLLAVRPQFAQFMFDTEHEGLCFERPAALVEDVTAARARVALRSVAAFTCQRREAPSFRAGRKGAKTRLRAG